MNFASQWQPASSTIGQLWFNTVDNVLYIRIDPIAYALVSSSPAKYFPTSSTVPALDMTNAWASVWSSAQTAAGLAEFNGLAIQINKIIGAVTSSSSSPSDQFGWGQTDLVPQYDNLTTLSAGFTTQGFPISFDNSAWVILLSRLRKALRQIGQPETLASPIGFVNDSKPSPPGNTIANAYNSYPTPGTLANYTAGWNGFGSASINLYYANTVNAISTLQSNRFALAPASAQVNTRISRVRGANWGAANGKPNITHTVKLPFASHADAQAYFNAGGTFTFQWSHAPSISDTTNLGWQSFLAAETGLVFDYQGTRRGTTYVNNELPGKPGYVNPDTLVSIGFYDLTSSPQVIYIRDRLNDSYAFTITDGGVTVQAYAAIEGGQYVVTFVVMFTENGVASVQGVTSSVIVATWPNNLNTNSPIISLINVGDSGDFM